MSQAQASTVSLTRLAHNVQGEAAHDMSEPLDFKMAKITDLMLHRLTAQGVEATFESLVDEIFDLRFDVLFLLKDKPLLSLANLWNPFELKNLNPRLQSLVIDIMPIYIHMTSNILTMPQNAKVERFTLRELESLSTFMPYQETQRLIAFIMDSLKVEFGLIVCDLIIDKKLNLLSPHTKNLFDFLKQAFERYAARAALLGVWDSESFHINSQFLRNIQIVQACMVSDMNEHVVIFSANTPAWSHFKEQYA